MTGRLAPLALAAFLAGAVSGPALAQAVYVVSQEGSTLTPVAPPGATIPVGKGPAQVAAGPDGRLYLAHSDTHTVSVVDGRTGAVLARFPFAGQPFGVAVARDGRSLFVGDWSGGRVVRLSSATGAVEGGVGVGRDPAGLVLDAKGRLYVADRESRQVSVVETATLTRIGTVPVGEGPFALALNPAEDRLYVANVRSGDLHAIDTATLKPAGRAILGGMPYGVAVSGDGARVLVTNQQAGTLHVLDAALKPVATIPVGRYPEGVAVAGDKAYVANWFSDSVSVIDLPTLAETARLPVGEGPRGLAVLMQETP
ncbi:YncE family protein [Methylobacterium sp. J-090]|uniref:YncE family protein n=1 Tax=Methylobacterium sp. J-090 TaxID=2836666 RepID=UPI001FB92BD8|nr:YncE family protein [Methylobacterium sp. J-090]MCJ2083412.1 YncE family protein [Methylobacterium sp. J-090]